jgi:hypothetical protein
VLVLTGVTTGEVDLELRPASTAVEIDDTVDLGLYARSDDPVQSELISAMEVVLVWEPRFLDLQELDDTGGPTVLFSGFPVSFDLNEQAPPRDGDALYQMLAPLGAQNAVEATPDGTLITTLRFRAVGDTPLTTIRIVRAADDPEVVTRVFDGARPNSTITGALGHADITIGTTCSADVDGTGAVDIDDLVAVVLAFGACPPSPAACPADVDCNGVVDIDDIVEVVLAWGGSAAALPEDPPGHRAPGRLTLEKEPR